MQILWHGHSFFEIRTKPNKKTKVKILIDPFDKSVGLPVPRIGGDLVLVTHDHHDHNNVTAVTGEPFVIDGPGEYEIKNIFIQGIPSFHDDAKGQERGRNTIYLIESEGITICHLGDLGQKELTEGQLEKIGEVDILMIPVGGNYTISAKEAAKIMSQIEPRISIPMHYALPRVKVKLDPLSKFLKVFGLKTVKPMEKLVVKEKELPSVDEAKIIVLKL